MCCCVYRHAGGCNQYIRSLIITELLFAGKQPPFSSHILCLDKNKSPNTIKRGARTDSEGTVNHLDHHQPEVLKTFFFFNEFVVHSLHFFVLFFFFFGYLSVYVCAVLRVCIIRVITIKLYANETLWTAFADNWRHCMGSGTLQENHHYKRFITNSFIRIYSFRGVSQRYLRQFIKVCFGKKWLSHNRFVSISSLRRWDVWPEYGIRTSQRTERSV